jgi:ubiquinone/menaquinone biosynthesis C-methylase UbiE
VRNIDKIIRMDFDTHIGFWIEGMPYIWIPGKTIEESKRIYQPTVMDDNAIYIFDENDGKLAHPFEENAVAGATYSILPLSKKGCNLVRNCFLVDTNSRSTLHQTRIEGKSQRDYHKEKNIKDLSSKLKLYTLPSILNIIDPDTGFKYEIPLYIIDTEHKPSLRKKQDKLILDFMPSRVIYNKDSHSIAQKITRDRRKNVTTKELLQAFYKTHISEETWSTNKSVNAKYYEWFTIYTKSFEHPTYVDIGCGSGKDVSLISKEIHASTITCADVKDSRTSDAKSLNFLLIQEDVPLEIESNTVDIITLFHTIHHMKDAESRLKDIYRILVVGGLFIIKDHNVQTQTDADNVTFEHFVYSIGEGEAAPNDEETYRDILPMYYYSASNLSNFLVSIGFKKLYLHAYTNATKTYNAVFKK